eukprot:scaffold2782_cov112-Isochrysis_galbana.AAC.2
MRRRPDDRQTPEFSFRSGRRSRARLLEGGAPRSGPLGRNFPLRQPQSRSSTFIVKRTESRASRSRCSERRARRCRRP